MNSAKIKTDFHKLINKIDNSDILENFFRAMSYYAQKQGTIDILDELTEKQRKRLATSLRQADAGKTITHKQMKREILQWLAK